MKEAELSAGLDEIANRSYQTSWPSWPFAVPFAWIMNAMISYSFPVIAASSGAAPFAVFAAMMVAQFFVVLFMYPETKGLTLEEMQKKFRIR